MAEAVTSGAGRRGSRAGLVKWVPGYTMARTYKRGDLKGDAIAGLAVTALLIPQGMAYAELSGLPAVTGLYTTIVGLIAYAVFGPSRMIVIGPDSALSPLILATILPLVGAGGDPAKAIALGSALAVLMGLICVFAGLARLGIVTELLSRPIRIGYLNGVAVVIVVSQLPKLCGFSVAAESTPARFLDFVEGVAAGLINPTALAISGACLALLFAFRWLAPKFPAVLLAVVGATLAVWLLDLVSRGVPVVGPMPQGFPAPALPAFPPDDLWRLTLAALGMAFITVTDASTLSRTFAARHRYTVDPNQEIAALGAANVAVGFFQGFPTSTSTSRTAVAEAAGAHTQLVGLIGAATITVLLVVGAGLTTYLPQASLAAIVVVAGTALFDLATLRWLWRVRRSEFLLCLAGMAGVAVAGVLQGMAIAIGLSVLVVLRRMWRPYDATLGRVLDRHGYHDIERHPDAQQVPGLLLFRFDAPIFFANAEHFVHSVRKHMAERGEPITRVVIAGEPITDIDTTGAEALRALIDDLAADGVDVGFAELKGPVKDRLQRYGLYEKIGDGQFYSTVDHAVFDFVRQSGQEPAGWVDDYDGNEAGPDD